ncbi:MFS transporter [Rhizobium lentis]|uniref:MFS transporter n=1 Tax=Rhizobium lentis TaxID=1138194 RepID=UPI001A92F439|nr:MFS transporter [Rhizobium lentis]MBX4958268.1 MFS transporter [Rhizobium lentis]MBX4976438.1 MFS transporter [Rhizobium lentis]MBX4988272.1 MFS transporter [Rhizobium lentis]MBX5006721.1 MFS transporter [Rhizobium lentis]MBX5031318.1 MFS transporter [Rhizobium lentis]
MTDIEQPLTASVQERRTIHADSWRFGLIALIAFLTLVDLFAAQAVLPSLVERFQVSRATMGFAVNASTLGMALAGLLVAFVGSGLDRRNGIWISLAILSVPTTLLAFTDNIIVFAALRVLQGLCMSTAFTLTAAYLSEHFSAGKASTALAAYVTGNVASNLFGRMLSAAVAGIGGLSINFLVFAALNLLGAALVWFTLKRTTSMMRSDDRGNLTMRIWGGHLADPKLRRVFAIGFLILFVFIGTYTYVNFRIVTLGVRPMALGLVYLVFLPSIFTTPFAGRLASAVGPATGIVLTLAIAIVGLVALLSAYLPVILIGLTLVAVGTFLAQAMATGVVGQHARGDKAGASGIYLASYYTGGMAGSVVLGQVYDHVGWNASVYVLIAALAVAMLLAGSLSAPHR